MLAGCEGACASPHISPSIGGSVRVGCLLLVRDNPCCIHHRGLADILCSGSSGSFFPVGSLWGSTCGDLYWVES